MNFLRTQRVDRKTGLTAGILSLLFGVWIFGLFSSPNPSFPGSVDNEQKQMQTVEPLDAISTLESFLDEGSELDLPKRFRFEKIQFLGSSLKLAPGAEKELNKLAELLADDLSIRARLEGFTDNLGDPLKNLELSDRRVEYIRDQLVARGAEESQIETAGLGGADPVASNETLQGRALNRRIELVILEKLF